MPSRSCSLFLCSRPFGCHSWSSPQAKHRRWDRNLRRYYPFLFALLYLLHAGCELVVAWAERELAQNATEAEIEVYLDKVCETIPSIVRAEVSHFCLAVFLDLTSFCRNSVKILSTDTRLSSSQFSRIMRRPRSLALNFVCAIKNETARSGTTFQNIRINDLHKPSILVLNLNENHLLLSCKVCRQVRSCIGT